jgi:hypothetical protein
VPVSDSNEKVQLKFFGPQKNRTSSNTRRRYPQARQLLTLTAGTARLRGVGAARPTMVEARLPKPLNSR